MDKVKTYGGKRDVDGDCLVFVSVDSKTKPLDLRLDLINHSPTGFNWGYLGSGPAQLSLAILADCVDAEFALTHYQEFKELFVGKLQADQWKITSTEVLNLVSKI